MSLYQELQNCKSEEDVKDCYIKALKLKDYHKGLVDIKTKEVWFETKQKGVVSTFFQFAQLFYYVQKALDKGDSLPQFLCVADQAKAAIMRTADAIPFLAQKTIKWGASGSKPTPEAVAAVSACISPYIICFNIATHEKEFIDKIKVAIKTGDIIRRDITPTNVKSVYDEWCQLIGQEIDGELCEDDKTLLFHADAFHDGTKAIRSDLSAKLLFEGGEPVWELKGRLYRLRNYHGYKKFWARTTKPPKPEYQNTILSRRDSLIPFDERHFKGAFYTPLKVVDEAYELLNRTLENDWQENYVVWDMCCGVGNLEVRHSNPRNVYMSTLDQADVDMMKTTRTCTSAQRFQYDYLNDDITEKGVIDYALTSKLPQDLQDAIKTGKKILVLINPPYAEASNKGDKNKPGVAKTKVAASLMADYGKASNELFVQFLARIAKEIPTATVAMFSTMKYANAPNFEKFRSVWNAQFLDGFVIHNRVFDGLTGNFPIGFLVWQMGVVKAPLTEVIVNVYDKNVKLIGDKSFCNLPNDVLLNTWIKRPKTNKVPCLPLINAVSSAVTVPRVSTWSDGAIGYMSCAGNDLQQAGQLTAVYSSTFQNGNGFYITPSNLWQAAVVFAVRRLIKPTWLNNRDQFLQPMVQIPEEFKTDCLIWMLFNGSNLSAGANAIKWNDKSWSLVNHFIPFKEDEVGASERFESDFMVRYMAGMEFSTEAVEVMEAAKELWKIYNSEVDVSEIRDAYSLNRPDVGWYQIRKALEGRIADSDASSISFETFKKAYAKLTDKLVPQVYELGFLR